jgi:hypothetical protein
MEYQEQTEKEAKLKAAGEQELRDSGRSLCYPCLWKSENLP